MRDAAIEASVPDRGIVGANPLLVNAVGYIRLLVPTASVDVARDLLAGAGLLGQEAISDQTDIETEALAAEPVDESIRSFLDNDKNQPDRSKSGGQARHSASAPSGFTARDAP